MSDKIEFTNDYWGEELEETHIPRMPNGIEIGYTFTYGRAALDKLRQHTGHVWHRYRPAWHVRLRA